MFGEGIISSVVSGVASIWTSSNEKAIVKTQAAVQREALAQQHKKELMQSKHDLRKARLAAQGRKYMAKHQRELLAAQQDFDYDREAQRQKERTWMDEFLIFTWIAVFVAHFVPALQPFMAEGWSSMGYGEEPAWWYEFGMVGILASTLGLRWLFKAWVGGASDKIKNLAGSRKSRKDEPKFPEGGNA